MKALLLFLMAAPALARAADVISLHPDNPHYFLWKGKATVLVTSGEHYGALMNGAFDYVAYFEELASKGLNHTRIFSGVYREVPGDFGITENTLAPAPGKYVAPWERTGEGGESDGGNKFDLTRWDAEYFKRLHALMGAAERAGIVVEFTLFCPMYADTMWKACPMYAANNVNGIGGCGRGEVYVLKHGDLTDVHVEFTKKVVSELRGYGNLYYEICNEPYVGGVTEEWQREIIGAIVEAEKEFPAKHLISLNVANGRKKVVDPHPAVSIFNFHYCVPPDVVAVNYGLDKVIGENETGFRGRDDVLYRTEGWDFLLAGGALYNSLDYSFTVTHPRGTLRDYKSPGGGSSELREQLGILRRFLEGFDFVRMGPAPGVVKKCEPDLTATVLAEPGKAYAVYLHVPIPEKPKNLKALRRAGITARLEVDLPEGKYRIGWLDTKSGRRVGGAEVAHGGGTLELVSPAFDDDIALAITAGTAEGE